MKEQINIKICTAIISVILLIGFVSAFGVSSSYWKGNPLVIAPDDTRTISLRLQNVAGDEDIIVRAALIGGFDIASTEEKDYIVKIGTKDTEVPIKISIPSDMPLGTEKRVTVAFRTITPGGTGGVVLGTAIDTGFDVLVADVEKTQKEDKGFMIGFVILIAIILSLIVAFRRKKK